MPTRDGQTDQQDDAYWHAAREMVRYLIHELNQNLKSNRITEKKRRKICTETVFGYCQFLDHGWLKSRGQTRYPVFCFSHQVLDVGAWGPDVQADFPDSSVEWHGMVHDEIDWYFDQAKQSPTAVSHGRVGAETPDSEPPQDPDTIKPLPCWTCKGSGQCYCLRKGPGTAEDCPRCAGTGECRHCSGTGKS